MADVLFLYFVYLIGSHSYHLGHRRNEYESFPVFAFAILRLLQRTYSTPCSKKVDLCPMNKSMLQERMKGYNCPAAYVYTCLPDENYNFHERCSPAFLIWNGTGGCPFIEKCHNKLGFIYGNAGSYRPCPENETYCPPVYHGGYNIQDLYNYPACFFKDRKIPKTSSVGTEIPSVFTSDDHRTEQNFRSPFFLSITVNIVLIILLLCVGGFIYISKRRKSNRNSKKNRSQNEDEFEELEILQSTETNLRETEFSVQEQPRENSLSEPFSSKYGIDVRVSESTEAKRIAQETDPFHSNTTIVDETEETEEKENIM